LKRDISLYVKDIADAMDKAERFIGSMSYEEFLLDERTNYAVIKCIEIIGEAVKQIPKSLRRKYIEIPWKDMAGMRDKVIHIYFGVKMDQVWLSVKEDIPRLKPQIRQVLEDLAKQE
jgi:uncharacterized protein with HEPN domain